MKTVYAIFWTMTSTQAEFDAVIPDLLNWLQSLKSAGKLRACGGFLNFDGGLTIVEAADEHEAKRIAESSPQARLGKSQILAWEVFDANLQEESHLTP